MNQVTNMHEYKSLCTKHWNKAKKHKIYSIVLGLYTTLLGTWTVRKDMEDFNRSKGNARLYCVKLHDTDNKYQKH